MPYEIVKQGKKFVVRNKETKDVKGTFDSRPRAVAQLRLLYGIEGGMTPRSKK